MGKTLWRGEWQPTLGFLPEESHGQRSLAGYNPWGYKRVRHDLALTFTFACVKSDGFGVSHLKHPAFSLVFTESVSYFASKVTNTDISKILQSLTRSRESLTLFLDQEVPSWGFQASLEKQEGNWEKRNFIHEAKLKELKALSFEIISFYPSVLKCALERLCNCTIGFFFLFFFFLPVFCFFTWQKTNKQTNWKPWFPFFFYFTSPMS